MLPTTPSSAPVITATPDPSLIDRTRTPRGVIQKNLKLLLYVGVAAVLVLATLVSSFRKKPGVVSKAPDNVAIPDVQNNTANNVAAYHAELKSERQHPQDDVPSGTPAQQAAGSAYGPTGLPVTGTPCVPGQPCSAPGYVQQQGSSGGGGGQSQLSPADQISLQLAAKERERQYASRFESNLVYSQSTKPPQVQQQGSAAASANLYAAAINPGQPTNLTPGRAAGEAPAATYKRSAEVNIDNAVGQPYVLYEGMTLDTVLVNRLDGDAAGPVKVLVSNPVYSHDRQHILIPEGTIVLGEARKIGSAGFGQQRRMAVVFHRLLMPDGYSVDLDQFHGLDQIGQEGLKDQVNNHYLQIFGTSIALGVISGAAQITQGGSSNNASGPQQFVNGASSGVSQQATTILNRFIQIPPTITIREGHRVKVYFTQDMLLPAYENHRIPQSF